MSDGIVGAVKVKPLVWERDPEELGEDWFWRAKAGPFVYEVGEEETGVCWWQEDAVTGISSCRVDGDIAAAKAAAQADYEARIMAALDVQPMDVKISLDTSHVRAMLDDAEKSFSHLTTIAATITVNALRHGATHTQIMDFITGKSDFVNWLHDQVKPKPLIVQNAARVPEIAALIEAAEALSAQASHVGLGAAVKGLDITDAARELSLLSAEVSAAIRSITDAD